MTIIIVSADALNKRASKIPEVKLDKRKKKGVSL
jgi:hypothetical protein